MVIKFSPQQCSNILFISTERRKEWLSRGTENYLIFPLKTVLAKFRYEDGSSKRACWDSWNMKSFPWLWLDARWFSHWSLIWMCSTSSLRDSESGTGWCSAKKVFWKFRSGHRSYSIKKGVLKSFAKFTGKHLCQSR